MAVLVGGGGWRGFLGGGGFSFRDFGGLRARAAGSGAFFEGGVGVGLGAFGYGGGGGITFGGCRARGGGEVVVSIGVALGGCCGGDFGSARDLGLGGHDEDGAEEAEGAELLSGEDKTKERAL